MSSYVCLHQHYLPFGKILNFLLRLAEINEVHTKIVTLGSLGGGGAGKAFTATFRGVRVIRDPVGFISSCGVIEVVEV
jgi:hypothetical protein